MSTDLVSLPPRQLSMGRVLKDTFRFVKANLLGCAVVGAVYVALGQVALPLANDPSEDAFSWWNFAISELLGIVVFGFASSILIYVVLLTLGGTRSSIRDWTQGLSLAVPVVIVLFICGLPATLSRLVAATEPSVVPQIAIGLLGYLLVAFWFAAAPTVIAEGLGPLVALRRSTTLTAGCRGRIFGLLFMVGIAFWAIQLGIWHIGNVINAAVGHTGSNLVFWIADYVLPAVGLVFWSVVQTVAYAALRHAKESGSTQDLARVFD